MISISIILTLKTLSIICHHVKFGHKMPNEAKHLCQVGNR